MQCVTKRVDATCWLFVFLVSVVLMMAVTTPLSARACEPGVSSMEKPDWADAARPPIGRFVEYTTAPAGSEVPTIATGVADGVARILYDLAQTRGVVIRGKQRFIDEAVVRRVGDDWQESSSLLFNGVLETELADDVVFRGFRIVDVYWERRCDDGQPRYLVSVLGAVPRKQPLGAHEVPASLCRSDVLWRSALVPGWGQIRNNRTGWGATFMSSMALGLAATATGFAVRARVVEERNRTFDAVRRATLNNEVDIWSGVGWAGVGLMVVTYAVNLLHAGLMSLPPDYRNYRPDVGLTVLPVQGSDGVFVALSWTK